MVPRPQRFWIPASAWRPAPIYLTAEPLLIRMELDTNENAVSNNADTESLPDAFASQQGIDNAGPDDPGFDYIVHDEPPIGRDEYGQTSKKNSTSLTDAINAHKLHLAPDRGRHLPDIVIVFKAQLTLAQVLLYTGDARAAKSKTRHEAFVVINVRGQDYELAAQAHYILAHSPNNYVHHAAKAVLCYWGLFRRGDSPVETSLRLKLAKRADALLRMAINDVSVYDERHVDAEERQMSRVVRKNLDDAAVDIARRFGAI